MDQEQVGDMSHVEAVESVNASLQVQEEEQEEEQEQEQEEEQQQEEEVEQEDEEAHRITQLKSSNTRQTLVKQTLQASWKCLTSVSTSTCPGSSAGAEVLPRR